MGTGMDIGWLAVKIALTLMALAASTYIIMWSCQDNGWVDRRVAKVARRIVRWLDELED